MGPVSLLLQHPLPWSLGIPAKFCASLCLAPMQIKQSVSNLYVVISLASEKTLALGVVKSVKMSPGFTGRASPSTRGSKEEAFLLASLERVSSCGKHGLQLKTCENSSGRTELEKELFPTEGKVPAAILHYYWVKYCQSSTGRALLLATPWLFFHLIHLFLRTG